MPVNNSVRTQFTERGLALSGSIEGVEDADKYDEQACASFAQTAFGSASNSLNELYKEIGVVDGGGWGEYGRKSSISNGNVTNNAQQISTSNDAITCVSDARIHECHQW